MSSMKVDGSPEVTTAPVLDDVETPTRQLARPFRMVATILGVSLSCLALYGIFNPVAALQYRATFLGMALMLLFLLHPALDSGRSPRHRPSMIDWILITVAVGSTARIILTFDEFVRRTIPAQTDLILGIATIVLVLEAARRTTGVALPIITIVAVAYGYLGGLIPASWGISHAGYGIDRIIGQSYMGLAGVFGTPLAVAATFIIVFTIFGAVLEQSGASRFFVNLSFAIFGRSKTGPGRVTALAGYLLGSISGSGAATAVTLGTITWPVLRKGGYSREEGGGLLAAAGVGALLAPPMMGAVAFIVAEFLAVSYFQVVIYAAMPALLYYVGLIFTVVGVAHKLDIVAVEYEPQSLKYLLSRYSFHFVPLLTLVLLLMKDYSALRSVVYSMGVALVLSFLRREGAMWPRRVAIALYNGAANVVPVAAVTALAGVIVSIISITGVGTRFSNLIISGSGGSLFLGGLLSAVAVTLLGLALPAVASFIIAVVVVAPALVDLGVEQYIAFMFVFYFAILAEISPPTATAAFAVSGITGGKPLSIMMVSWKYALIAYIVPFALIMGENGNLLLMQGSVIEILLAGLLAILAVAVLSIATTGMWPYFGSASWVERGLCGAAGVAILGLEALWVAIGGGLLFVAIAVRKLRGLRTGEGNQ